MWHVYQHLTTEPATWPTLLLQPNWLLQVENRHQATNDEPITERLTRADDAGDYAAAAMEATGQEAPTWRQDHELMSIQHAGPATSTATVSACV